jgi:pyruvate kinase
VAISFPRSADDVHEARRLLEQAGGKAGIIAKIERIEALQVIDEIIQASDGIMVARGDLGVEIGDAELPAWQKRLISLARNHNRVVITATQMMESMIENPIPTRAEVFDVANAVLDGTDAVMLSAETASGKHPLKVIEAVARVCISVEKEPEATKSTHRLNTLFHNVSETIALSTMYAANHLHVKAIIALTESGSTALSMSRISSAIPIYGLTRHEHTIGRMCLYRGVQPIKLGKLFTEHAIANMVAVTLLKEHHALQAAGGAPAATGVRADAVLALCSLGLTRAEAEERIGKVRGDDAGLEELVRRALK